MITAIVSIIVFIIIIILVIWNWATNRMTPLGFEIGIGGAALAGLLFNGYSIYAGTKTPAAAAAL